jgi:CubicO group peptidase (beta-lactamase class C family)
MGLQQRVDAAIAAAVPGRIVGCVVLLWRGGRELHAGVRGLADREAGIPMRRDTLFRLASVTKPIVAAGALRLVDAGRLGFDDPVTRYLPWFTPPSPDGSVAPILIRHLLTHTSGLSYDVPDDVAGGLSGPLVPLEENLRRLARAPLKFAPGSGWEYGMSLDVLGGVIAAIEATTLGEALARLVTGPLGMAETRFGVSDAARLAVPYADDAPPRRMGEPEAVAAEDGGATIFSPARIFQADLPQSGGAGMAGTADDVMRLLEALRAGPFLTEATRRTALGNRIGSLPRRPKDAGKRFGFLGAVVEDPVAAGFTVPKGAVDWGGAWGHNWIIDPTTGTSVLTCTNTAFEGCNGAFRQEIAAAVFG